MTSPTISFNQVADECQETGLNAENAAKIAAALSRSFGVHDDEVAIFKVEQSHLKFMYPKKLSGVGVIPLNQTSSLAARTASTRRPEVINNFSQTKHASIFESVAVDSKTRGSQKQEKSAMVIQKIMSVPVMSQSGIVGVIQLSRKGITPRSAGADFQPSELQRLVTAAHALGKCFK